MSGNAAAYILAKRGLSVLQLERGEYSGSKNVQGAIMYADMLEEIIPDFREDAPLERHLIEQRFWMMNEAAHTGMHYRSDAFNEAKPNRYTILRSQFDKWFSRKVREAGALVLTETTALELIFDAYGACVGVRTDREGGIVHADVVVLAEGVNGLLGSRAGLRAPPKPDHVALAVKEMHFLPAGDDRVALQRQGDEGVVIEAVGTISGGAPPLRAPGTSRRVPAPGGAAPAGPARLPAEVGGAGPGDRRRGWLSRRRGRRGRFTGGGARWLR